MIKNRKAIKGGKPKYFTILRNWAHQGFFYLDKTEMFYRILWGIIPILIINSIINPNYTLFTLIVVTILVHTYNWITNNNFWAVLIHSVPSLKNPGEKTTISYLCKMQKRLVNSNSISGVLIYGSISRNKWHDRSDIDIRFFRKKGIYNGFVSYLLLRRERIIALINKQPLDAYIADDIKFLKKMRRDEYPFFLKNIDKRLFFEYSTKNITNFNKITCINSINDESN